MIDSTQTKNWISKELKLTPNWLLNVIIESKLKYFGPLKVHNNLDRHFDSDLIMVS